MSDESQSGGTILAIDNVPLDLPIAGAASRSLAAFLDYLIAVPYRSCGSSPE